MEEQDERFAVMSRDPRFKHIPKRERKVKIDRRFEAMFKDKNFKLKYSIDKRGRPVQQSTNENLKRFYEISDSDCGLSEDEQEKTLKKKRGKDSADVRSDGGQSNKKESVEMNRINSSETQELIRKKKRKRLSGREELKLLAQRKKKLGVGLQKKEDGITQDAKKSDFQSQNIAKDDEKGDNEDERDAEELSYEEASGSENETRKGDSLRGTDDLEESEESSDESSSSEENDTIQERVDYSRGKAFMESSSSSESDGSDLEGNEFVDLEHDWGEMDTGAKRSEDTSSRLALCNMDWDRITAQDILVLLSSFKPSGGVIKCVKIYISDFGLERMKDEDVHGPKELVEDDQKFKKLSGIGEKKYFREKLRKYQMQRLKYFYAVVECDSKETASHIYDQCDGFEFESSAVKLDLRFIPDDLTFDREPKEVAENNSLDMELYKPSEFVNSALQQSKVDLTWDEDDPRRLQKTQGAFKKENLETADLDAYIASSSGDEDVEAAVASGSSGDEDPPHLTEEERLEQYRSLVRDLDKDKQDKEDADAEMEITWEPGLKETTEELVAKKLEEKDTDKSPWQQYLEKKKEKRKQKKEQERTEKEKRLKEGGGSDDELAFSDDELPAGVDLDDPFFSSEKKKGKKKQTSKRNDEDDEESIEEDADSLKRKAELELLVMDDDDNKQHFNLREIMEQEQSKKKKKKNKKQDLDAEEGDKVADNFEVDVKDSRFEAIYSSHHFAIDPSDPQFKPTKAMKALLDEKQARRMRGEVKLKKTHQVQPVKETEPESASISKTEVSALVKSIKRNTSNLKPKGKTREKMTNL